MPIMNSAEERRQNELKEERKQTLAKFFDDFKASFIIWIRIGGITVGVMILIYLFAKIAYSWDLFYESDLEFQSIFFAVFIFFTVAIAACWFIAFFLYNTKHKRNTKYKTGENSQGGQNEWLKK